MLTQLFQVLINGIGRLGDVVSLLPASPFQNLHYLIPENPAIDAVLWIVPVAPMLGILQAWLTAIGVYYAVKVPLRWAKVVKS